MRQVRCFHFLIFVFALYFAGQSLSAQTYGQLAPGAREQFNALLNKPAMVRPATATALGKNWFKLETDAHVITDGASFRQVSAALLDVDNTTAIFDGKKSKLTGSIVSRGSGGTSAETVVDFLMTTIAPMGIHIKTPYRAAVRAVESTESKIYIEIRQLATDSDSNKHVKHLFAMRYAEEITVDGKTYTYIRIFAVDEVNASILPGAKGVLENNSDPANTEALHLIIAAAKNR